MVQKPDAVKKRKGFMGIGVFVFIVIAMVGLLIILYYAIKHFGLI